MKKFYSLVIIILMFLVLESCNNNNNDIKIGVLFPMTGDAGQYGVDGKKAIDLAIEEVNSNGGINGKKIEVIFEDSKAEPKTGVTAMQKLVSIDKVSAVIGDIVSSVSIPAAVIAEKNKVIMIAPTSSAPAITNSGKFIYRVWPSDLLEGASAGNYAKKNNFKKAYLLHLNNDYGTQIAEIFKKNFETDNQKVVGNDAYDAKVKDFKTILLKVKNSNSDIVYIAGYYEDTAEILKQSSQLGIKVQFIGATAIEDQKFLDIAGKSSEGIVYPLASGFDSGSSNIVTQVFVKSFKQKYNYMPTWVESHCYDAFMLVVNAMKKTGKNDSESIRKYIDTMGKYDGVTGSIIFDENGDVKKQIVFKTVKQGKFVTLN